MSDDLETALEHPEVAIAFQYAVNMAVDAAHAGLANPAAVAAAGLAFAHLHNMVGGGAETHQRLKVLVHDAAAEKIKTAGMARLN